MAPRFSSILSRENSEQSLELEQGSSFDQLNKDQTSEAEHCYSAQPDLMCFVEELEL